tara:strand:+ start:1009 stop:1308 length:300 start_codon:yes stop_codon:yes gene_type:complete
MNKKIDKIFENYFKENVFLLKNDKINTKNNKIDDDDIAEAVVHAINAALSELSDENPAKNKEIGLKMIKKIKNELKNPIRISKIIDEVIEEVLNEESMQ